MSDDRSKPQLRIVAFPSEPSCFNPTPEPMGGSAKLLSLRHGTAYLSTIFQAERAELPEHERARVNSMIDLFFQRGIGTHSPSASPTRRKMHRFDCAIGTIYYFRSRLYDAPIMQCFTLHGPGGGGGLRSGPPRVPECRDICSQVVEADWWDRRIAARFEDLLKSEPTERVALRPFWLSEGKASMRTAAGRRRAKAYLRADRLLGEIADSCRSLCVQPDPSALPTWSLLGGRAHVAEQLENEFARAIFAGEAVSQLGRSLSLFSDEARGLDLWRRRRGGLRAMPIDAQVLYEETLRALRVVDRRGDLREPNRCQYLISLSFSDDDLLGDARCLSIVRSEIIFHFSTILNDYRIKQCKDVEFRFAKFAYFTELSKEFFGVEDGEHSLGEFVDECVRNDHSAAWVTNELVRNLDEFGYLSVSIVDWLVGKFPSASHPVSKYDRLSELASQILLEDVTGEADHSDSSSQVD